MLVNIDTVDFQKSQFTKVQLRVQQVLILSKLKLSTSDYPIEFTSRENWSDFQLNFDKDKLSKYFPVYSI